MNSVHKHIEFKIPAEENKNISYLDLSIHRDNNQPPPNGMYRKPMQMYTAIHFMSNHPLEHKLAAYKFLREQNVLHQSQNKQDNKIGSLSAP